MIRKYKLDSRLSIGDGLSPKIILEKKHKLHLRARAWLHQQVLTSALDMGAAYADSDDEHRVTQAAV